MLVFGHCLHHLRHLRHPDLLHINLGHRYTVTHLHQQVPKRKYDRRLYSTRSCLQMYTSYGIDNVYVYDPYTVYSLLLDHVQLVHYVDDYQVNLNQQLRLMSRLFSWYLRDLYSLQALLAP
jgi:hypothetical protein